MFNLDLTNVKTGSDLLENGAYLVRVDQAEIKQTKDGTGEYINVKFKTESGKTLFHMFNIKNKNNMAVEIGLRQLKEFMLKAGSKTFTLKSVTELEGLSATAIVKTKTDEYGEKNVISYFKEASSAQSSDNKPMSASDVPF